MLLGQFNSSKKKKKFAYVPPSKQKKGSGGLIWLTIAFAFIAVVIILGINNSSKDSKTLYEFNYSELPRLGDEKAPVKLVEFGDYTCGACRAFSVQVKPDLVKDFIEPGKVALYFANYAFIGPGSKTAAIAAESVYLQNPDAFWPYNDAIYANQGDEQTLWATPERMVQIAKDAKLDIDFDKLASDIDAKVGEDKIDDQKKLAEQTLNIPGTPTLFVNGQQIEFKSYGDIKAAIESKLQ
ncbi:disulfide bond formation protein DsbA [Paenibacillus herberti]|uniref:Disulfide bond formation protein DsbA n=1 Tax=Paenibacillus herberti TaxID=1619309 RepID=A0A229P4A3_9BACL|nr:disulfide bond formation protein DsbA [Paenibacillus herberti]